MIKKFNKGNMKVKIYKSGEIAGRQAAFECYRRVLDLLTDREEISIAFMCHSGIKSMYKELSKLQDENWAKVNATFFECEPDQSKIISRMTERLKFSSKKVVPYESDSCKIIKQMRDKCWELICIPVNDSRLMGIQSEEYIQNGEAFLTMDALLNAEYLYVLAQGEANCEGVLKAVRGKNEGTSPLDVLKTLDKVTLYSDHDAGKGLLLRKAIIAHEISGDFENALKFAKEHDAEGVELQYCEVNETQRASMKVLLKRYELVVSCIATDVFKCRFEDNEKEYEKLEKAIDFAVELGAPNVRVYSFLAEGGLSREEDEIIDVLRNAANYAKQKNVVLVLENEKTVYGSNGKLTATLVKKVGSSHLRCLWDPCNDLTEPEGETPYPTGYHSVRNHYSYIRLKDAEKVEGKLVPVPLGESEEYDLKGQIKGILAEGYDGFISIGAECGQKTPLADEERMEILEESMQNLQDILLEVTDEM